MRFPAISPDFSSYDGESNGRSSCLFFGLILELPDDVYLDLICHHKDRPKRRTSSFSVGFFVCFCCFFLGIELLRVSLIDILRYKGVGMGFTLCLLSVCLFVCSLALWNWVDFK